MKEGDIIFESLVFSHVITPDFASQVCDYCLNLQALTLTTLQRCASCQLVYYCDRKCQKEAWSHHKIECKFIVSVKPNIPPPTPRHLIRTLIKLKKGGSEEYEELPDGTNRYFSTLMTHENDISKDKVRMDAFSLYFKMVQMCFGEDAYNAVDVFKVFCRLLINSVGMYSCMDGSFGTGLYLAISAIDHSCQPNVNLVFTGRTAKVSAMEPMSEPVMQKLRISYYCEMFKSWKERQEFLVKQYYFICDCSYCEKEKREEKEPSLPCSNCDNQEVIVNNGSCSSCGVEIDKDLLKRYNNWHAVVDALEAKQHTIKEAFSAYKEGLAMGVKNDQYLLRSNYRFVESFSQDEEGFTTFDKTLVKPSEIENICQSILSSQKNVYHMNSMQITSIYTLISVFLCAMQYASKDLNSLDMSREALRITELCYTTDSSEYRALFKQVKYMFG